MIDPPSFREGFFILAIPASQLSNLYPVHQHRPDISFSPDPSFRWRRVEEQWTKSGLCDDAGPKRSQGRFRQCENG